VFTHTFTHPGQSLKIVVVLRLFRMVQFAGIAQFSELQNVPLFVQKLLRGVVATVHVRLVTQRTQLTHLLGFRDI
jgi:hypothetical protein